VQSSYCALSCFKASLKEGASARSSMAMETVARTPCAAGLFARRGVGCGGEVHENGAIACHVSSDGGATDG
jgi:hypothetical protein